MPVIDVINQATVVTDDEVELKVKASQLLVDNDLTKAWALSPVKLNFVSKTDKPNAAHWWIVLTDNSDVADALGYHTLTNTGLPLGKAFPGTCEQDGSDWGVDVTHELEEMLIDPYCQLSAQDANGTFWAYEIADPCQDDSEAYEISVEGESVLVSDFVYPAWFNSSAPEGAQMDFKNHITKPFTLASGGYASTLTPGGSGWTQVFADKIRPAKVGTRREKRFRGQGNWELSTVAVK